MAVFTVHEPPRRFADAPLEPERFAFVRDGFSIWAFLLAPLWMLRHRMWLVLACYVAIAVGLEALVKALGASEPVDMLIGLFVSLLVGLEAGTLRRFTLTRRHWTNIGVVSGDDREDAERRFFETWVSRAAPPSTPTSTAPPMRPVQTAGPAPRMAQAPDVVGLFPEPGAQR
jgi:Protein of unknown function (DUF2628)